MYVPNCSFYFTGMWHPKYTAVRKMSENINTYLGGIAD